MAVIDNALHNFRYGLKPIAREDPRMVKVDISDFDLLYRSDADPEALTQAHALMNPEGPFNPQNQARLALRRLNVLDENDVLDRDRLERLVAPSHLIRAGLESEVSSDGRIHLLRADGQLEEVDLDARMEPRQFAAIDGSIDFFSPENEISSRSEVILMTRSFLSNTFEEIDPDDDFSEYAELFWGTPWRVTSSGIVLAPESGYTDILPISPSVLSSFEWAVLNPSDTSAPQPARLASELIHELRSLCDSLLVVNLLVLLTDFDPFWWPVAPNAVDFDGGGASEPIRWS